MRLKREEQRRDLTDTTNTQHFARYFRRLVLHDIRFQRVFCHCQRRVFTYDILDDNLRPKLVYSELQYWEVQSVSMSRATPCGPWRDWSD